MLLISAIRSALALELCVHRLDFSTLLVERRLLLQDVLAHHHQGILLIHARAQLITRHRFGFGLALLLGSGLLGRRVGGVRRQDKRHCRDKSAGQQSAKTGAM
jgi:hypothetical protein